MSKISFIVPIYNVEKYLENCIKSIQTQTLKEIEIVCVEDYSTDQSAKIITDIASQDNRVKVVYHEKNMGLVQTRRDGIKVTSGEYIWMVDSDDFIGAPDIAEKIYNKAKLENVDIFNFGTTIELYTEMVEYEYLDMVNWLKPYEKKIYNQEVFSSCFVNNKYSYNIWNKLYKADVLKKVADYLPNNIINVSDDLFINFLATIIAKSYLGDSSLVGYHYCYGRGMTNLNNINLGKFKNYNQQAKIYQELQLIISELNMDVEYYEEILEIVKKHQRLGCVYIWKEKISSKISAQALELLCESWGFDDVFKDLYSNYWNERALIAYKSFGAKFPIKLSRTPKVIGVYYHRIFNGGVEKVIALTIPILINIGYQVVLITDEAPSDDDYPLPEILNRFIIQNYIETNEDNYGVRAAQWNDVIMKYNIDIIVYHAWNNPILFWDMLAIKKTGSRLVAQTHSIFFSCISWLHTDFQILNIIMSQLDGIITITNVDRYYWSAYNKNTFLIPNPISKELINVKPCKEWNNNIIWVARFDKMKRPHEALEVMKKVVNVIPNAQLYMIGQTEKPEDMDQYIALRKTLNLENNVEFLGFHQDISSYYEKASIHLMTSEFEGFSMVLLESKAYGIPTVMYNLDYLDMVRDNRGLCLAEVGDVDTLAEYIIELLQNRDKMELMSISARESFEDFAKSDTSSLWKDALSKISSTKEDEIDCQDKRIVLDHLLHICFNTDYIEQDSSTREVRELNEFCGKIINSVSFKIGRAITWLPRKIRKIIQSAR